jgi:hypothetical protein
MNFVSFDAGGMTQSVAVPLLKKEMPCEVRDHAENVRRISID